MCPLDARVLYSPHSHSIELREFVRVASQLT